jgi:hypothetical protein
MAMQWVDSAALNDNGFFPRAPELRDIQLQTTTGPSDRATNQIGSI